MRRPASQPGPEPDRKRAARAAPELDETARLARLFSWLTSCGAKGLEQLSVRASACGGLGVFAPPAGLAPGSSIASVPAACALTTRTAARSAVGRACAALHESSSNGSSSSSSSSSSGGAAAAAAAAADEGQVQVPPKLVLLLDMAAGRTDAAHRSHPYLAALPWGGAALPDCTSWPATDREALAGTNVGAAAAAAAAAFDAECARWLPRLRAAEPALFAQCDVEALRWARAMHTSRCFPAMLVEGLVEGAGGHVEGAGSDGGPAEGGRDGDGDGDGDDVECGVMLPFFDLLNHAAGTPITWHAASAEIPEVRFSCGGGGGGGGGGDGGDGGGGSGEGEGGGVAAGAEIFSNYGPKSNEELLMAHGFALHDNVHDTYALSLRVGCAAATLPPGGAAAAPAPAPKPAPPAAAAARYRSLGPFHIRRADSPLGEQFPAALWAALASAGSDGGGGGGGRRRADRSRAGGGGRPAGHAARPAAGAYAHCTARSAALLRR